MKSYDLQLTFTEDGDIELNQTLLERGLTDSILLSPDQVPWLIDSLNKALAELQQGTKKEKTS